MMLISVLAMLYIVIQKYTYLAPYKIYLLFREKNCKSVLDIIDLQNDYICGLHNETGHKFKKFYDYRDLLKKWIDDKFNKDLYTFRNQSFKSVVTGVESTVNKTLFMDNFDDTMEGILSQMK